MTTLQEYLNQKYPTKEDKEKVLGIVDTPHMKQFKKGELSEIDGGELDLREFKNLQMFSIQGYDLKSPLTKINLSGCSKLSSFQSALGKLTSINLNGCSNLCSLICNSNNLVSVDFLNQLPCPKNLGELQIFCNDIEPTDIKIFSKFVNLKTLRIGTTESKLSQNKRNKFYGSLASWQNFTELRTVCIEATDIDSGLEYLTSDFVKWTSGGGKKVFGFMGIFECSPHGTNARCSIIQDQLRKYDYDIEAWQLSHPHLMYKARPELFSLPNSKEKWLKALSDKMAKTRTKLQEIKQNSPNKIKKIKRLETKLFNLELIKDNIKEETVDKETQTDLDFHQLEVSSKKKFFNL